MTARTEPAFAGGMIECLLGLHVLAHHVRDLVAGLAATQAGGAAGACGAPVAGPSVAANDDPLLDALVGGWVLATALLDGIDARAGETTDAARVAHGATDGAGPAPLAFRELLR